MIITFSGHRPPKIGGFRIPNPIYDHINKELKKLLEEIKPDKAISGMALGFDQWAAEVCLDLNIPFIAAVPHIGQEKMWPQESKDNYEYLISKASEVVIVSEGCYAPYKMQIRNQWMADRCDKLIACFDGSAGGTYNCIQYAKSIGKE